MKINPRDYIGPMFGFPFVGAFNYKEILQLPDKEFAEFYLTLMREYRDKDNWWEEGNDPILCQGCGKGISDPRFLRRLSGRTLEPICFAEEIKTFSFNNNLSKKYFERVAKLDLSLLDG